MVGSVETSAGVPPRISAVVPTLDEAAAVAETLQRLRDCGLHEIIVADGGSADGTAEIARSHGARVLSAPRGRGSQLAAGALAATGDVLWFVHADTHAPPDAGVRIAEALRSRRCVGGSFEIRFGGGTRAARLLTWFYRRIGLLGLRYGDAAFFATTAAYHAAGGFRPLPIFEDLDLLRRLRRLGRFGRARAEVVTSSRRFEGRSFALVFARWATLQVLYWLGVPPRLLVRAYRPVRAPGVTSPRAPSPAHSPATTPSGQATHAAGAAPPRSADA